MAELKENTYIGKKIDVLNHGHVTLVDYMGTDADIVSAARVSYGKGTKQKSDDVALIRYMMRHRHTSVFEQVIFKFHVKAPIVVFRQWHRHRTQSINELSARYSEMPDEFYLPAQDRIQKQSTDNKQGSGDDLDKHVSERVQNMMLKQQKEAYSKYQEYLKFDIARETARLNMPVSLYSEMYTTQNLHNLFHFLSLRMDSHCYDDQTEVLTSDGWKLFRESNKEDYFYSLNPNTNTISLIKPTNIINQQYSGEMISVQGQSIDLLVTSNHKLLVKTSTSPKASWELKAAEQCLDEKLIYMTKTANCIAGEVANYITLPKQTLSKSDAIGNYTYIFNQRNVPLNQWLRFLGFYLSDGYTNEKKFEVGICKGNSKTIDFYQELLKNITPAKVYRQKAGSGTCERLVFEDGLLCILLSKLGNVYNKYIPKEIFKYDYSHLMHLYYGLLDGDSNYKSAPKGKDGKKVGLYYSTSSEKLADDFQRLLLHLGLSGSKLTLDRVGEISEGTDSLGKPYRIETKNIHYLISINQSKNTPLIKNSVRNAFSKEYYEGSIHCVTLPKNHTLLVRRNGKVVWSGNSQYEIRQYANAIYELIKPIVPISCEAFNDYRLNSKMFSAEEVDLLIELLMFEGKEELTKRIKDTIGTYRLSKRERKEFKQKIGL